MSALYYSTQRPKFLPVTAANRPSTQQIGRHFQRKTDALTDKKQPNRKTRAIEILVIVALLGIWMGVQRLRTGFWSTWQRDPVIEAVTRPPERAVAPLFSPDRAALLLEGQERDAYQLPDRLVDALHLHNGESVGDIGAGSGYLMSRLSHAVGPTGRVYEEEIQEEFLSPLRNRAKPLHNVEVLLGKMTDPCLRPRSVDCMVLLTVYHEVQQPVDFLRTLHKAMRPGGRLAIIDFDAAIKGHPEAPEGHWVARQAVIDEARKAGWSLKVEPLFLRSASQFYLIFQSAQP